MAKKLSTQEILAAARAEASKQAGDDATDASTPPAESIPETETAPEAVAPEEAVPASESPAEAPAATPPAKASGSGPKSTKDILAAARAQASAKPSGEATSGGAPAAPAKGAGGGKPTSTKDILAAARAQSAAGGASPASEKATPAKPAKAGSPGKAVAKSGAAASGATPTVAEMLKAVREDRQPKEEEKPAAPKMRKPKRPVPPVKPAAKKGASVGASERRFFLLALIATPFAFAWTMFSLASAAATLGLVRYMMPNIVNEPPSRFKVGSPGDYPPNSVATKWKAQYGIWLVNSEYQGEGILYALISICTHLGCTPNWLEGEQKFKCPCHGSGFYITGINFEGPAPRPLERAGIRLAPDGMIEVDKSVKFQQELGQWDDPASKLSVV